MVTNLRQLPGIGDQLAARITRHLGNGHEHLALQRIQSGPYSLTSVPRIGFKIADAVALFLGVHRDSPQRHAAGNEFILAEDGTLPLHEFDAARTKLDLTCFALRRQGVVEDAGRVWLPEVLAAEQAFATWAAELPLGEAPALPARRPDSATHLLGGLDEVQTHAALCAVYGRNTHVMALDGGAGTGKTRVIGGVARLAREAGLMTAVAAFAGKAADRVRESLSAAHTSVTYAGTIHKLLSYDGQSFRTGTLPHDLVVLDEASMIPTILLWEVVRRLKPGARLLLVGDPGQLPPVGYGQPYADLIALGVPRLHLAVNYRSASVQGIIHAANAIREGRTLAQFPDDSLSVQVASDLSEAANTALLDVQGLQQDEWQLITWKNDDATAFNLAIQEALNPTGFPLFSFRVFGVDGHFNAEIREGDKVMVKANAYEYGVFNGQLGTALDTRVVEIVHIREAETLEDWAEADETGVIREVTSQLCVRVRIGGEIVNIPEKEAHELLTLGYAITVHKAQGSDWERVLIYQPGAVQFDAQRWWYTSVTRARSRCLVLYEIKVKGDAQSALNLWWANTRKTVELGPSIFVGRVKRALAQRLMPARTAEEWLK